MGEEVHPTPAHHLEVLLARAQNPFDISDAVLTRLTGAVMFQTELYGWRHRSTPPPTLRCSSFRHVFLLADGSSLLLWELCYDGEGNGQQGGQGGQHELYEIYESEEALRRSELRVHRWMDEDVSGPRGEDDGFDGFDGFGRTDGIDGIEGIDGFIGEDLGDGWLPGLSLGHGRSPGHRERTGHAEGVEYTEFDSPDHARRLLRRAENPDRPGEDTLHLLADALGHQIMHVPRPVVRTGECQVWCSVYEHVFLLADGTEVSLFELEHNLSGTGRLVCEVYLEEAGADRAAHRRARDHGIDL